MPSRNKRNWARCSCIRQVMLCRPLHLRNRVSPRQLPVKDWQLCAIAVDSGLCGLLNACRWVTIRQTVFGKQPQNDCRGHCRTPRWWRWFGSSQPSQWRWKFGDHDNTIGSNVGIICPSKQKPTCPSQPYSTDKIVTMKFNGVFRGWPLDPGLLKLSAFFSRWFSASGSFASWYNLGSQFIPLGTFIPQISILSPLPITEFLEIPLMKLMMLAASQSLLWH